MTNKTECIQNRESEPVVRASAGQLALQGNLQVHTHGPPILCTSGGLGTLLPHYYNPWHTSSAGDWELRKVQQTSTRAPINPRTHNRASIHSRLHTGGGLEQKLSYYESLQRNFFSTGPPPSPREDKLSETPPGGAWCVTSGLFLSHHVVHLE